MLIPTFHLELVIMESWIFPFHYPPLELAPFPWNLPLPFLKSTLEFPHGWGEEAWEAGILELAPTHPARRVGVWNLEAGTCAGHG